MCAGAAVAAQLAVVAFGAAAPKAGALGDWNNGWACYLLGGRPVVAFSVLSSLTRIAAPEPLPTGRVVLRVQYRRGARPGGEVTVAVDDTVVTTGTLTEDLPFMWQIGGAGLLVGRDRGLPVCDDYDPPFPCTAGIRAVVLEAPSAPPREADTELAAALHHE